MPRQVKQDWYFIFTSYEGDNFKGYRLIDETISEAKKFLNYVKKNGDLGKDLPVHSIILLKPMTNWIRIKRG